MRAKSIKNIYDKKHKTYQLDGVWKDALGEPEIHGAWLVWGAEKNGKTWFSLMLASYMSKFNPVLYISAEEGTGKDFSASCKRAGLDPKNKNLKASEYIPLLELEAALAKRRSPKIIVIDNLTIYNEEMKYGKFRELIAKNPEKIFIFLAHEEKGEPYTGTAKMCRRLAKIIVYVEGLAAHVSGRCPGGIIRIDEQKAQLYWGAS